MRGVPLTVHGEEIRSSKSETKRQIQMSETRRVVEPIARAHETRGFSTSLRRRALRPGPPPRFQRPTLTSAEAGLFCVLRIWICFGFRASDFLPMNREGKPSYLKEFPDLTAADVVACLDYAREVADFEAVSAFIFRPPASTVCTIA